MGAAEDARAKQTVLDVLQDPALRQVNFSLVKAAVSGRSYANVARAITGGQIKVMVEPSIGDNAHYVRELTRPNGAVWYDLILLAKPDLGSSAGEKFGSSVQIVHECTHAMFDLERRSPMTDMEEESLAYVAGHLFAIVKLKSLNRPVQNPHTKPLLKASWALALHLQIGQGSRDAYWWMAFNSQLHTLYTAILQNPLYATKAKKMNRYDGVGRPWIQPAP